MTDNEIIEWWRGIVELCNECHPDSFKNVLSKDIANDTLDLINRQKAEIERLNVELVGMRGACESYKMHYDNAQAEIKNLKADKEALINGQETLQKNLPKVIRESLKEQSWYDSNYAEWLVSIDDIDNIVEEMVGDNNGNNTTI